MGWMISESELDIFQQQVLNINFNNRAIIQGCAGSGKSVLALHLAKHIWDAVSKSVLVIVFTKALLNFMRGGIQELHLPENMCMLAHDWANSCPLPEADYIIVDEVQDFALRGPSTWSGANNTVYNRGTIEMFHQCAHKGLLMFGDDAQMLYRYGTELLAIKDLLHIKGGLYQNLVINYRLPKKVAVAAEKIMDCEENLEGRCKREGVNTPIIMACKTRQDEISYVVDRITELDLNNAGILVHSNDDAFIVYKELSGYGLNCEVKYKDGRQNVDTLDFTTSNPKIVTYHSAKGLQFDNVFIPFCDNKVCNSKPLYVAMTRTIDRLYITYSGTPCKFLARIPDDKVKRLRR